jgi:GH15 family glucan-1,4-alpha-glucosidase
VSKDGSIDWCCMPRLDSASCFGRLLDWNRGGYCLIAPTGTYKSTHRYIEDTLVLETVFSTPDGEVRLVDCLTMREGGEHKPHRQVLRVVEGLKGSVEIHINVVPVFDYGAVKPWIRPYRQNAYAALGGSNSLLISGNVPLAPVHRHHLSADIVIAEGDRRRLSISWRRPEDIEEELVEVPDIRELDSRLEETIQWWRRWAAQGDKVCPYSDQVRRSAIVLKGLSHAPSGAIAAAATTSLPEAPGGSRNWDYRFSWIRDSSFSVRALVELGYFKEGEGFRRFIERSAAGSADQLQVLYGVGGERRIEEFEIKELEGYRGARPVRIGNAASRQLQLDSYGDIVELSWLRHLQGRPVEDDYWDFLVSIVETVVETWRTPDRGIWEIRGEPRHFVHSKAMCWSAIDRGIKIAEAEGLPAPLHRWKEARHDLQQAIESGGFDADRGVFIQAFDHPVMDAALLLLPTTGFVDYEDERFVRTTDAIQKELSKDGLVMRYLPGDDRLDGEEGCFLACSFWLAACLARQRRFDQAHAVFTRALSTGNDLGLFSEEYLTASSEMLGNFPQGLSHLSLIEAALAIGQTEGC